MARKTLESIQTPEQMASEALGEWKSVTEMRYELAKDAYDFQDEDTKKVIDRMVDRLRVSASGYIKIALNPPHSGVIPVKIEQEYLDYNILYVATEILKDMALFDIRVASYQFPPSQCVSCGAELVGQVKIKGRRRH